MEFHQLHYFLAIAEHSSISKASKALHVSQSSLSVALRDLEHELGFPLFERNGRSLKINEDGVYLARQVRSALATIDDARLSIASGIERRRNTVKCATTFTLGKAGSCLMRAYREVNPDVVLRFGFKGSPAFEQAAPDLQFFASQEELHAANRCARLGRERFVAVFAQDSPLLPPGDAVRLEDLRGAPFVMTGPGMMQTIVLGMFKEAGFAPHVIGELQLYSEVLALVRAGYGFTIAPELTWLDDRSGLAVRKLADVKRERLLYASLAGNGEPSQSALDFFAFLKRDAERLIDPPR